jgi:hypothetical protein
MAAKTYRLKIVEGGHEFEAEGDKSFVLEMIKRFKPQASTMQLSPQKGADDKIKDKQPTSVTQPRGKAPSIREFIQLMDLKKHTDIILAFGYYLEKYTGVQEFTPADINNCYYEAKMESSNTSQIIVNNIRRGFMMASKKKGEKGKSRYMLTSSGEKFISSKLSKNL